MANSSSSPPKEDGMLTYNEGGGFDYELVGVSDSRYECPICLLCLRDPVLTTCGHKFCNGCITQWVGNLGGKCPVDAVSLSHENIFPDNFTRREIMQSKAKCPFSSKGCVAVLPVNEMERHVNSEHNANPTNSTNNNNNTNSNNSPNGVNLPQWEVVDCWFKEFGCDVRVHPSEIHKHMDGEVHTHLQLMTMAYKRLKLYSSSRSNLDHSSGPGGPTPSTSDSFWRQDSRESQRWLLEDSLDRPLDEDGQFRRQRSWDSVRYAQNKHNAKGRPQVIPPRLAESDESLCKTHGNPPPPGESSGKSLHPPGPNSTSTSSAHLNDVFERLVRLEQNDREKQIKLERMQGELTSAVKMFSSATQIIKDLTARYCHGVFVWTIPDFRKLCMEMRRDPNRVRHSPGFYTDTFGYKLCMRFNLTTPSSTSPNTSVQPVDVPLEKDEDTYISLYVHFMKGEFDDTLRWPFHGHLSLLIIHPSDPDSSIVEMMQAKPGAAFMKPALPRNPTGIGFKEFCRIDKAFLDGYVKNDCLVCKIYAKAQYTEFADAVGGGGLGVGEPLTLKDAGVK